MHKQRGKYRYLSVGGVGQYKQKEKYLSVGGGGNRIAQGNGEVQILISGRDGAIQAKGEVLMGRGAIEILSFGSYTGKQELGGIRVWSGHRC